MLVPADRSSNRKATSESRAGSRESASKKKLAKSRTVDNLEALLHLLDDGGIPPDPSDKAPQRLSQPAEPSAANASFMRELARARDDLYQVRRVNHDLEQAVEVLRHECATLQHQVAGLDRQRQILAETRFQLESQLEAEQQQRERLLDEVDANSIKLNASQTQQLELATELEVARRENNALTSELAVARSSGMIEIASLRAQLDSVTEERDASQASLWQHQAECAELADRISNADSTRIERLESDLARVRMELANSYEQLGVARLRLANSDRDRDHAIHRESEASRRAEELSDEVKLLGAAVQREAAARRKAEAVHKREPGDDEAAALLKAEQRIERLSRELAASKGVEAAYQQKAARKVQQVRQELETMRERLAELESRADGD